MPVFLNADGIAAVEADKQYDGKCVAVVATFENLSVVCEMLFGSQRRDYVHQRSDRPRSRDAVEASRCIMKSELPPDLAETVCAFRAEMIAEREEQERRLREALDHFKREVEIETAHFKREMEIEIAAYRRLAEIFKGARQSGAVSAARSMDLS
jgi:hypothetical protein